MAFARFFRLLAIVALCAVAGLSVAWACGTWFPTAAGELQAFQGSLRLRTQLASAPAAALLELWWGGCTLVDLLGAPLVALADLRWVLVLLGLPLAVLAWAAGAGARGLARGLPAAGGGSVAEVERRLGVGRRTAQIQHDAQSAAAWRAVLLAALSVTVLVTFRHLSPTPFAAAHAAAATALLAGSDGFRQRLPCLLWGGVVGLGLLIDPGVTLVLTAGPLLGAVAQKGAYKVRSKNAALGLGIAAFLGAGAVVHLVSAGFAAAGESWAPLPLIGLPALLLWALGLLGLGVRRPGWHGALGVWLGALLSAGALAVLDGGLVRAAVASVVPLAVLAGVGWGRWRVLTSPAGTTVLSVGTLAALLLLVQASRLMALPLGPLAPASEPVPLDHARTDADALAWLGVEGGAAVLDLAQARAGWGGTWLSLLVARSPRGAAVDWPLSAPAGPFVTAPCTLAHALVLHAADPWFDAEQVGAAEVGADPTARDALRDALVLARLCYRVERVEDAPGGGRVTWLALRPGVADLLVGGAGER